MSDYSSDYHGTINHYGTLQNKWTKNVFILRYKEKFFRFLRRKRPGWNVLSSIPPLCWYKYEVCEAPSISIGCQGRPTPRRVANILLPGKPINICHCHTKERQTEGRCCTNPEQLIACNHQSTAKLAKSSAFPRAEVGWWREFVAGCKTWKGSPTSVQGIHIICVNQ